jgi:hypothetical protein
MRTIGKLLLLPVLGAFFAGVVLVAGLVDFSASKPPGHLEERIARFTLDRSIARHAREEVNPLAGSPRPRERDSGCSARIVSPATALRGPIRPKEAPA